MTKVYERIRFPIIQFCDRAVESRSKNPRVIAIHVLFVTSMCSVFIRLKNTFEISVSLPHKSSVLCFLINCYFEITEYSNLFGAISSVVLELRREIPPHTYLEFSSIFSVTFKTIVDTFVLRGPFKGVKFLRRYFLRIIIFLKA